MFETNNQVQFVAVQFFTLTQSCHSDDADEISQHQFSLQPGQKYSNMESEESTNPQIFVQPYQHEQTSHISANVKAKSMLHNLQKHLFTFLQFLISDKDLATNFDQNDKEVTSCVQEILKLLKKQKRKTKEELVPVFGQFNLNKIARISQGYQMLVSLYPSATLRKSLQLAKQHLMSRINSQLIKDYLLKSKMQRKGEFHNYVQSFIQEVKQSKFTSRLTKKSQNFIKEQLNYESLSNDWADVIV